MDFTLEIFITAIVAMGGFFAFLFGAYNKLRTTIDIKDDIIIAKLDDHTIKISRKIDDTSFGVAQLCRTIDVIKEQANQREIRIANQEKFIVNQEKFIVNHEHRITKLEK